MKTKPVTTPAVEAAPEVEAPVTQAIGLERLGNGWRCVFIEMQGDKILSKVYDDRGYGSRSMALAKLKVAVVRRLIVGKKGT